METIGSRIKILRESFGYSMGRLEEALQVSRGSVNQWEKNKSIPGGKAIIALANFFNVSTDYILLGTEKNRQQHITNSNAIVEFSESEKNFLEKVRQLTNEERAKIDGIVDGILISHEINNARKLHQTLPNKDELTESEMLIQEELKNYHLELQAEQKGVTSLVSEKLKDGS